jgi:hypothetical protein
VSLSDVKAGDKVLLWNYSKESVHVVTRVTPTQVVLKFRRATGDGAYERRFNKRNGREVGASGYSRCRIEVVTAEQVARVELRQACARARETLINAAQNTADAEPNADLLTNLKQAIALLGAA